MWTVTLTLPDILHCLEGLSVSELRRSDALRLFTSVSGDSLFEGSNRAGLPRGFLDHTLTLGTLPQAVHLVLLLLDAFGPGNVHANKVDCLVRLNRTWALSEYQRLCRTMLSWLRISGPDTYHSVIPASLQFLAALQKRCIQDLSLPVLVPSKMAFACVWLQSLTELLSLDSLNQMYALQLGLGQSIHDLVECLGRSEALVACVEDFLPTLVTLKNDDAFQNLESCLQVVIIPPRS